MIDEPIKQHNLEHYSSGLLSLCFAARFHNLRINPTALRSVIGRQKSRIDVDDLILAATTAGMKSKLLSTEVGKLKEFPAPCIALLKNGEFLCIVKIQADNIVVYNPAQPGEPQLIRTTEFDQLWSGKILLLKRESISSNNEKFGYQYFSKIILKYKRILSEILIASFVIQLLGLATPLMTQIIIDKVVVHKNLSTLYVLGTGMVVVLLFETILTGMRTYLMNHTGTRIDSILSSRVFSHLLRLPLSFFEKRAVGGTISHLHELENIRAFIAGGGISTLLDIAFSVIFIFLMFFYSGTLTLIVLGTVPILVFITIISRPLMKRMLEAKNDCGVANHTFLVETLSGIHTLKSLAVEGEMHRRWQEKFSEYCRESFKLSQFASHSGAATQLVQKLSTLLVLCIGANEVINGDLSIGKLIAFQMLSGRAIQPMVRLAQMWQQFQQISLSIVKLADIMQYKPETQSNLTSVPLTINGAVDFRDVTFRYSGRETPALDAINLHVKAGEIVAIVGRSGSGKSTFSKIIQRLYSINGGKIFIDGFDIDQLDLSVLRRQIGVVQQESFLFSGSIRENILMHVPMASEKTLIMAAKLAGAHEFILGLPQGYDTSVGERGNALSGGQRQRVAIARALVSDPKILIFDEATSALDSESEAIIMNNFSALTAGRTTFVITHKLNTIKGADKIVVLDNGSIIEVGTHDELSELGGTYCLLRDAMESAL